MAEYIEIPLSGRLRGVTYENGKVTDVHIMDTDDVVKVFVPVRHGRWIKKQEKDTFAGYLYSYECSECGRVEQRKEPYCPKCGAKMGDKLYG